MADNGFIKLYKKMLKWEWYDDTNTVRLFLHCLLRANYEAGSWHGINYSAGQFITSLQTLANETNLTIKQVRVALQHLKSTNEVADLRQGNYRIITVIKWSDYQSKGRPMGDVRANRGQTEGKPRATDKEYKDIEEDKEIKNNIPPISPLGESEYVFEKHLNTINYKYLKTVVVDEYMNFIINHVELDECVASWMQYKDEKKTKANRYGKTGMVTLLGKIYRQSLEHGVNKVIDCIELSMSNSYQGITWEKLSGSNAGKQESVFDAWAKA